MCRVEFKMLTCYTNEATTGPRTAATIDTGHKSQEICQSMAQHARTARGGLGPANNMLCTSAFSAQISTTNAEHILSTSVLRAVTLISIRNDMLCTSVLPWLPPLVMYCLLLAWAGISRLPCLPGRDRISTHVSGWPPRVLLLLSLSSRCCFGLLQFFCCWSGLPPSCCCSMLESCSCCSGPESFCCCSVLHPASAAPIRNPAPAAL